MLIPADEGGGVLHASGGELISDESGESFYTGFEEVSFTLEPGAVAHGAMRVTLVVRGILPAAGGEPEGLELWTGQGAGGMGRSAGSVERRGDSVRHIWELPAEVRGRWSIVWRLPAHSSFDALELVIEKPKFSGGGRRNAQVKASREP